MAARGRRLGPPPTAAKSWQALSAKAAKPVAPTDPLAQSFARGVELHKAGKLREAGLMFQQVLAVEPNHPDASHSLGLVLHQMGNDEPAARLIAKAAGFAPGRAVFHSNLAVVLVSLGRGEEAVEAARRALKLEPDRAQFHSNLGVALLSLGRPEEAAQALRRGIARNADFADAHAHLGRALAALGRFEEADKSFARALAVQPAYVDAHVWRADARAVAGDLDGAIAAYREAVALKPDHAAAHLGLARVLGRAGRHALAADNYRAAAYAQPSAEAYAGLADELLAEDKRDEAVEALRTALKLRPDDAALADRLESLLGMAGAAAGEAIPDRALTDLERQEAQSRLAVSVTPGNPVALTNLASVLVGLNRHREAIGYYRDAITADPDYFRAWSELLFAVNYLGDEPVAEMVAEAKQFGARVAARIPARSQHANDRDPGRCIRLGLVSFDLRAHPVGRFLEAVLAALDREAVEVFAYSTSEEDDDVTARICAEVPNWRAAAGLDDAALEAAILADRIDVLVDLSGHTAHNRLLVFARKPAPVAFTWLGFFATTGLAAIDYVLANRWVIPTAEEDQWVERPWRLPETYLCFSPPRAHVPRAPPPARANGFVTFGSANNINKLNDATADVWAQVLHAVPGSRLLLRSRTLADAPVADDIRARFAARGIAGERLLLEGATADYAGHLGRYNDVDIALDPFPYAGGTTSVEALWMGVPVLTLRGDRYVAHMGENILAQVNLLDWVAADPDDYVAKAARFAADPDALAALRQNLRHRVVASPLFDASRFARHFEAAVRGMWQEWCGGGAKNHSG